MAIPQDPFMLLSYVNMKLRDGNYANLSDLCQSEGYDEADIVRKLKDVGFEYVESLKQFR